MSPRQFIERSIPLTDFEISRTDGRTVTAYAATFGDLYPVVDQFGDYDEEINRTAFNRELGRGIGHVSVFYNHGMTALGTPSDRNSSPIGTPLEIRPDGRGLLTVTRYAATPLGDEILELIRSEALRFQSFRGPVYATARRRTSAGRTILERTALGLKEYGPTAFPANDRAGIIAVRSTLLAEQIETLTDEQRAELARLLTFSPTPQDTPHDEATEPTEVTPPAAGPDPALEAQLKAASDLEIAEALVAVRRRRAGV
jgi:HK97 family phage prohead protease